MIKKISLKKIIVSTAVLFALFLVYLIPKEKEKISLKQDLQYVNVDYEKEIIYLLNDKSLLGRSSIVSNEKEVINKVKELINVLIINGSGEAKLPNGFKALIPSDTKVLSIKFDNGIVKVNFSKDILEVSKELEEKMVESIVYTLTSIEGVNGIIIYVDGDILTKLPQSNINLPSTLDRSFGINKEYDITSTKDINKVTIYYLDKYNDNFYYVPVTKYLNDKREKINIIIDELSSTRINSSNLMSFLSDNIQLQKVEQANNILELEFNDALFNDVDEKNVLEEVIYTISLSIYDNYDVSEIVFKVNNEEISKTVLKTLD